MSGFFQTVKNMVQSPAPKSSNATRLIGDAASTLTDSIQRGLKRKKDPLVTDDDDDESDGPVQVSPLTQRMRSRKSSEAISSSPSNKTPSGKKRRQIRSSPKKSNNRDASRPSADPQVDDEDKPENRGSMVPVADMGGAEFLEPNDEALDTAGSQPKTETETETQPAETNARKLLITALEEGRNDEADGVHEVEGLLGYQVLPDDCSVQVLVKWAGLPESEATYEPEDEIQNGAAEALFKFWKSKGGRSETVFGSGENQLPTMYHVFRILRHEKAKTSFKFEVQWVGYPSTAGNTTWETEGKLKKTAPEILEEYWESKGGRAQFLSKRGRGGKARTS